MSSRLLPPAKAYVDDSAMPGAGRGVFAAEGIAAGEVIERCPVVPLPDRKDRARLRKTGLVNYYFLWGDRRDRTAICLGWGSVYNHSFSPNARYEKRMEDARMDFIALRDILPGEEITVNYNGAPDDMRPLHIPGIPASAGGPAPTRTPRIVAGALRRLRLVKKWLMERPHGQALALVAVNAL